MVAFIFCWFEREKWQSEQAIEPLMFMFLSSFVYIRVLMANSC